MSQTATMLYFPKPVQNNTRLLAVVPEIDGWCVKLPRTDSSVLGRVPIVAWGLLSDQRYVAMLAIEGEARPADAPGTQYLGPNGTLHSRVPSHIKVALKARSGVTNLSCPETQGHQALFGDSELVPVSRWEANSTVALAPLIETINST